ncbi:MAG: hypothetical protein A4E25_00412 [Methanobacterium sp. PtaB.Bin024]|nr:MAG: hypothetical protein A4E25_00412 [Methanobacterium sp. PtaB.Bin024]
MKDGVFEWFYVGNVGQRLMMNQLYTAQNVEIKCREIHKHLNLKEV